MLDFVLEEMRQLVKNNRHFFDDLAKARRNPTGFYFELIKEHCDKCWTRYLELGRFFHGMITGGSLSAGEKATLMRFSEEMDHVLHNAAVLYLEETETSTSDFKDGIRHVRVGKSFDPRSHMHQEPPERLIQPLAFAGESYDDTTAVNNANAIGCGRLDYELQLQRLWLDRVGEEGDPYISHERFQALLDWGLGHTILGKIVLRRKTQFHDDGRIEMHPGFWGLFIVGSMSTGDKGSYTISESDPKENSWRTFLEMGGVRLPFMERVPRFFADVEKVDPGIYFHRSKAHGRDEFLAWVSGKNEKDRKTMVFCTKGVGADFDLVKNGPAGRIHGNFEQSWEQGSSLPFSYAKDQGSWSTLGFCSVEGNVGGRRETEIATGEKAMAVGLGDILKEREVLVLEVPDLFDVEFDAHCGFT